MTKGKAVIYLGVMVISISVVLFILSLKQKNKFGRHFTTEEVHQMIVKGEHYILPVDLSKSLEASPEEVILIDLRSLELFENYHPESAVNIPFQRVLDDDFTSLLKGEGKKVLYSSTERKAAEVWILLKQMGVDNVFVLKGGLSYWQEKVEGRDVFGKASFEDEKPRYDFKKELSGDSIQ